MVGPCGPRYRARSFFLWGRHDQHHHRADLHRGRADRHARARRDEQRHRARGRGRAHPRSRDLPGAETAGAAPAALTGNPDLGTVGAQPAAPLPRLGALLPPTQHLPHHPLRRPVPASATPSASASRASYAIPIPTASPCSTSNFAVASIAWPTVWPKLRMARRPASRSSAATTSALISTDRRTSLSTTSGGAACLATVGHSRSRKAKYSRSAITPCLTASAMPAASCAGASEPRASRSATTSRGWWNAPSRFFPAGTSTPVFPPIEESIIASRVVGTWT